MCSAHHEDSDETIEKANMLHETYGLCDAPREADWQSIHWHSAVRHGPIRGRARGIVRIWLRPKKTKRLWRGGKCCAFFSKTRKKIGPRPVASSTTEVPGGAPKSCCGAAAPGPFLPKGRRSDGHVPVATWWRNSSHLLVSSMCSGGARGSKSLWTSTSWVIHQHWCQWLLLVRP